jgi:hypothetical protein
LVDIRKEILYPKFRVLQAPKLAAGYATCAEVGVARGRRQRAVAERLLGGPAEQAHE